LNKKKPETMIVRAKTPEISEADEGRAAWRDALIAIVGFTLIVVVLISVDFFEFIYYLTRDHENWEIDEFFAAIPAAAATLAWFAYRRWRQYARLTAELKAAFSRRQRMEDELRDAQRVAALGQLAGGLAHEINNTLQPVFALAGLCLDQKDLSDQTRKRIERIIGAAERGRDISRKALLYTSKQYGNSDPIALSDTLSEIVAFLDETTAATLHIDTAIVESPATARVETTELMQVLTNLVGNAADAMESKGRIQVTCEYVTSNDDPVGIDDSDSQRFARISVADEGTGMSDDVKKRVFDPFFSTKRPGTGTGLGLSVVYGIVERWGGEVRVESKEGAGSVVHILVPIDPNNASERSNHNE
jgi:signal transduction histidine kinase